MKTTVHLLGYASAVGGVNPGCSRGPLVLRQSLAMSHLLEQLAKTGKEFRWVDFIEAQSVAPKAQAEEVQRLCQRLALKTAEFTREGEFFIVTGGDHTSAIGTWSGVRTALSGPLGLIWIDAHMDSHTPETSESGRLHGMPLAALLGYGDSRFKQLLSPAPKVNPEQLCLIGVRSYERGEAALLKKLGVRIYFMEEIQQRGLAVIFKEALERVNQGTFGYGLSLDMDSLDPEEAPGVDVPEANGLSLAALCAALRDQAGSPRLLGMEVVEFNPERDIEQRTEKAIVALIEAIGRPYA